MKVNRSKNKLQVRVTVENLGTPLPQVRLPDVIRWLQDKQIEYMGRGFENLELHFEADWDSPSDLVIVGTREETEREYNARMRAIARNERQEAVKMQEHIKFIEQEAKRLGVLK